MEPENGTGGGGHSPAPPFIVPGAPAILRDDPDAGLSEDEQAAQLLAGRFGGHPDDMLSRVKTIRSLREQYGTEVQWIGIAPCDVTQDPKIFFVLSSDTPDSLIARYMRVYQQEADQFRTEVVREKLVQEDPKGFSTVMRELRLFVQVPMKLREFLKILDPNYWEDESHLVKTEQNYPLMGGKA